MLVIGSRALAHWFRHARAPLDWDLVGTSAELEALRAKLPPLANTPWSKRKAYFLHRGRPLEVLVPAAGNVWEAVLARSGAKIDDPLLGSLTFASPETLLLLKLAHAHLPSQWDKTVEDIDFLRRARVELDSEAERLLSLLCDNNERWLGPRRQLVDQPLRLIAAAGSDGFALRRELHRTLGDRTGPWLDPKRPHCARSLPRDASGRAALLAELAMAEAIAEDLYPSLGTARADTTTERAAVRNALRALATRQLGREARLALAPHALDAERRIPTGFSHALQRRLAARAARCALARPAASLASLTEPLLGLALGV
jgi:hypothetical protein